MSAAQSETFSTRNIVVLGVLLLLAVFIGEVVIGPKSARDDVAMVMDSVEDIAMRLQPVISLEDMRGRASASAAADTSNLSAADLYQSACYACHATGAAGAPKLGVAAEWSSRIAKGVEMLVASAINGIGVMPPRGGSQLSDEQMREVVEYIVSQSQ